MKRKSSMTSSKNENPKKKSHGLDQWKALITSFLMQSLTLGTLESFGALYVPIMDTLLKDDPRKMSKAALIGSLTTGFLMGFSPISSMLIDKIGAQLVALLGGVIVFMATLTSSFVTSFYLMALFYGIIFGIGCSMLFISSNVVISRYFEENSTVAYGILGLGNGLMNSIMPHIISHSVDSIKLAGTIRIICFLLSSIMFFPLYWSSYKYENTEEPLIAYIPTRILSTKVHSKYFEESIHNPSVRKNSKSTIVPKNLAGRQETNENFNYEPKFINTSNKKRKKYLVNSEIYFPMIEIENSNEFNFNVSNDDTGLDSPLKKDDKQKDVPTVAEKKAFHTKMETISHDYNYPDTPIFQKSGVSQASSSLGDELTNKFGKEVSFSSSRTREQIISLFKNMKCCQAEVFRSKPYVTLLFGMFIAMFGYQVPNVHIVKYAQEIAPAYNGQLLLTCLGGSSALGPFINGIIMDRFDCRISKYRLYQIFVIAYGIVILILAITTNYSALIIVCLAIGYLDGSFTGLFGPLTIDLVGVHHAGQAIGIFFGVIAPAVMVAPPLAGFIYDSFSNYKFAFFGAGLFFLIGGLLLSISHTTSKPTDPIAVTGDFTTNVFGSQNSDGIDPIDTESASHISTYSLGILEK